MDYDKPGYKTFNVPDLVKKRKGRDKTAFSHQSAAFKALNNTFTPD